MTVRKKNEILMQSSESIFRKNLLLWSKHNPQASIYLDYVDTEHLQLVVAKDETLNLINKDQNFYYHAKSGSEKELDKVFAKVDLDSVEVIYFYGVGLGHAYEYLKSWLKKKRKRHLVFLEDDLGVIRKFFETPMATKVLRDKQVMLHYFDDLAATKTPLSEMYWNFMTLKFATLALPSYSKKKSEKFLQLQHKLAYDATLRFALVDEYLKFGIAFFRNFYANILSMSGSYLGNGLFGKFKNVPAIICGAGPSLSKNVAMLSQLKEKAIIFAGGSAMNALNAQNILPHFGAGIDPNPDQEVRISQSTGYEIPFLFRNRLYHEAFQRVKGAKLYVTGSGGYDIAAWFESKFGIGDQHEELDEGFNIVNFCLAIAHAMGCNPIVFVGLDLAYTDMEAYAKGVIEKSRVRKKELLQAEDLDSTAIERPDIYGKPVYTLWKWVAESNWISDFAKEHLDAQLINATEGGIGFPDIANEKLSDVAKLFLTRNFDISNRIHGEIQNHALPQITPQGVLEAVEEMEKSLERSLEHLSVLEEEAQHLANQIKESKIVPENAQSGRAALAEIELAEEPAYQFVLEIFNAVYSRVLNYELQQALHSRAAWRKILKKTEITIKRFQFLKDVAKANIAVIQHVKTDRLAR